MKREIIRVEPYSTFLEQWKAPASIATRAGDMIYVSGLLPFHPEHGLPKEKEPFEVQAVHCMDALKRVLEAADSDFDHILKCDILCTSPDYFVPFNEIYRGYFSGDEFPARIFSIVPSWTGPFDLEVQCVALARN